jgi:hypothetical protein
MPLTYSLQEFNLGILEECVALGVHKTLITVNKVRDSAPQSLNNYSQEQSLDALLQAVQLTLIRHINNVVNMLPVPHRVITYGDGANSEQERYREKMEDFFTDSTWLDMVNELSVALLRYLISLPMFPWQSTLPSESVKDFSRFTVLCLEVSFRIFLVKCCKVKCDLLLVGTENRHGSHTLAYFGVFNGIGFRNIFQ